jgi:hypothetical protein
MAAVSQSQTCMSRAGIFIGVDQTGKLQKLNDAAAGAARMYDWAHEQDFFDKSQIFLVNDAGGRIVTPDLIYDHIKAIIDGPGVDQLIIYFAGHGININHGEVWLLSEAPVKASAAVNLKGTVELAQYSGINHVVFFSDACRVAPDSIQAANVRGIEIFPNDSNSDVSKPVDQFFACGLGKTAAEIKDPTGAATNFSALYSDALLSALKGEASEALRAEPPTDPAWRYVGSASLRDYLAQEIPRRIIQKNLAGKVNQNPDAIVIDSGNWISRVNRGAVPQVRRDLPTPPPPTLATAANTLLNSVIAGTPLPPPSAFEAAPARHLESLLLQKQLSDSANVIVPPFGPDHFETECGIKVRGAGVLEVFAQRVLEARLLDPATIRIGTGSDPCVSVLLRFDTNTCAVIPAINGYLAALTFANGDLVDVSYEPATTNFRWQSYQGNMNELRRLRSIIAAAAENGHFRLNDANASTLARRMQYAKGIDPTLGIYAAYAYYDLQKRDLIRQMCGYMRDDIGAVLFDLELLGRRLFEKGLTPTDRIVPFFPMLAQGWALLKANRFQAHPVLAKVQPCMKSSLWTLFGSEAFEPLKLAIANHDIL